MIPLLIEPLRSRKEDLDLLCEHFIGVYKQQLNKDVRTMSPAFRQRLEEYAWPGNVRELQNVIEYVMNIASGSTLIVEYLPEKIREPQENGEAASYNLETLERETILLCLQQFGNTVQGKERAAQALGIGIATLYRKLVRYKLTVDENKQKIVDVSS